MMMRKRSEPEGTSSRNDNPSTADVVLSQTQKVTKSLYTCHINMGNWLFQGKCLLGQ